MRHLILLNLLLICSCLALLHRKTENLDQMDITTPEFKTMDGSPFTFTHQTVYQKLLPGEELNIVINAFGTHFTLKLHRAPNEDPTIAPPQSPHLFAPSPSETEYHHPVFLEGYVKEVGQEFSSVKLSYVPGLDTLSGFIELPTERLSKTNDVTSPMSSMLIHFDQWSDLHEQEQEQKVTRHTSNIVYKDKTQNLSKLSALVNEKLKLIKLFKRQQAAPVQNQFRLNHDCPVVVIADANFQRRYGSGSKAYITEMYNNAYGFYKKELGLGLVLDRIIYQNIVPSGGIQNYLTTVSNMLRNNQIDGRTRSGRGPCLVHVITFTNFAPSLGLAYVGPQPPPVHNGGQLIGRDESVVIKTGGMCSKEYYNVLVTTIANGQGELPKRATLTTLLHEVGHAGGASHREQCCGNIYQSLGITQQNANSADRQKWAQNSNEGCRQSYVNRGPNGPALADMMAAVNQIDAVVNYALGWCVRGMIWRFILANDQDMIKDGCIVPAA